MAVLRLTSKKTLPLLLEALRRIAFTQTELAKATGTSIGRVNKVITWLKEKEVVLKETGRYVITRPNALADLIADQQVIRRTRTYNVAVDEEELRRAQDQGKLMYCLRSATGTDGEEREVVESAPAQEFLDSLPRGERQITLYRYEAPVEAMDQVRAIIDLRSAGQRTEAQELASGYWRTRQ